MRPRKQNFPVMPRGQGGGTLAIVLILLLIMTLLGLAALRSTLLQERMAGSMRDRGISFQAAESALREAELRLETPGIDALFPAGAACQNGLCGTPARDASDRWRDTGFAGWFDAARPDGNAPRTQYFIESMGTAPAWPMCEREVPISPRCLRPRYRITARSGEAGRAEAIVQTSYTAQ